jgi:hypothetical protein
MNDFYSVVKIDLCGSKDFIERNGTETDIRGSLIKELLEIVYKAFPHSNTKYPDGSLYSIEGDAVYLIISKPTVALRATIEFMKQWYSNVPAFPDCRSVIEYGFLKEIRLANGIELHGEAFENINKIEKVFSSGQIGVTASFTDKCDQTLVQFIRPILEHVTEKRTVETWLVNYDNPRLLQYSNLSHALFIADPSSVDVRDRAIEALIIEAIFDKGSKEISITDLQQAFQKKCCPDPGIIELKALLSRSSYLEESSSGNILLRVGVEENIQRIQMDFEKSRDEAVNFITRILSEKIGVPKETISEKLHTINLLEEYLCAVYLEIRMMANYFRSTNVLFEKLSATKEYDYIIVKYLRNVLPEKLEEVTFVKREFLEALKELALTNNEYLASIFHNVLMLYYLNRNTKLSHGQLAVIKNKDYILDANTLYAYMCHASEYYEMLHYSVDKLVSFGAKFYVFDRSLDEYTESIESALSSYKNITKRASLITWQPWIWKEFADNTARYKNNFEFCVMLHRIPKKKYANEQQKFEEAYSELKKANIELIKLDPFLNENEINEIYDEVYQAKKKYDPLTHGFVIKGSPEKYHCLVLHDANCLNNLRHDATNPFSASKLFITCDFSLTKLRRKFPAKYEYLITVPEFYEFMLPYLFMDNLMVKQPVQMPNFLLASALHKELFKTFNFKDIFGDYIAGNIENIEEFEILSELSNDNRYKKIKEKHQHLVGSRAESTDEEIEEYLSEATKLLINYSSSVQLSVANHLIKEELDKKDKHISTILNEQKENEDRIRLLEEENIKLRIKEIKRIKYDKKVKSNKWK